jgi:Spy/CpxP family protein refolding chaperone
MIAAGITLAALASISLAQAPQDRPFPPGGPGGPGRGPGGPGGPGGPNLVLLVPVQKELKLTDSQKTKLKTLESRLNQKRRQAFARMQDEEPDPGKMRTAMEAIRREQEKGIGEILDKTQKARLAEIELQRDGLLALAKPEIAKKLKLTSNQSEQVQKIIDDMRQSQRALMPPPPGGFQGPGGGPPGAGAAANGGEAGFPGGGPPPGREGGFPGGPPPGGEGGFPGGGPPGGDGAFPDGPPPGGQAGAGNAGFRAQFAKIRQEQEKIRSTAMKQLAAVLTPTQKSEFDKMQGKPFDLSSLRPGPGAGPGTSKAARPGSRVRPQTKSRRRNQQEAADPGETL